MAGGSFSSVGTVDQVDVKPLEEGTRSADSEPGGSAGMIGGVVAALVAIAACCGGFFYYRSRQEQSPTHTEKSIDIDAEQNNIAVPNVQTRPF